MLVEEHPDQQRERIGVEQLVGVSVARDGEGALHGAMRLRLRRAARSLRTVRPVAWVGPDTASPSSVQKQGRARGGGHGQTEFALWESVAAQPAESRARLELMAGADHAPWVDHPDHVAGRFTAFLRRR